MHKNMYFGKRKTNGKLMKTNSYHVMNGVLTSLNVLHPIQEIISLKIHNKIIKAHKNKIYKNT